MLSESSDIMKSEDFDHIKEESIVFQNQIKELEMKLKIANQKKEKSRADKLLEHPVKAFNISNKNEESYFYVDEDEERDKETTQLRQASNKKVEHEKIASDNDDSDSKGARNEVLALLLNTEVHSPEISENDEDSQEKKRKIIVYNYSWHSLEIFYVINHPKDIPSWANITSESEDEKVSETSSKRRRVTDYDRSIMYSRNSKLETGESSTIGMIQGALNDDSDNDDDINKEDSNYS
ncbi:ATP-dependent DNA helicase pif1 [Gigaspora margarita]|uniref:ATP-dependent DNA helicase pif1 n=1 Tax=Gigaspora margarita TaxID=4874 RepID=A0A8H4ARN4_GIGMA|nr:ATP-dependent DNA helicase pif1 [Gigaspora margarita]